MNKSTNSERKNILVAIILQKNILHFRPQAVTRKSTYDDIIFNLSLINERVFSYSYPKD